MDLKERFGNGGPPFLVLDHVANHNCCAQNYALREQSLQSLQRRTCFSMELATDIGAAARERSRCLCRPSTFFSAHPLLGLSSLVTALYSVVMRKCTQHLGSIFGCRICTRSDFAMYFFLLFLLLLFCFTYKFAGLTPM